MNKNNNSNLTKIIVVGANGRMGREICDLAGQSSEFELVGAVENATRLESISALPCPVTDNLDELLKIVSGVVIDFTNAETSIKSAKTASNHGCPIVIGSTGLNRDQKNELERLAHICPIFISSNMSLGINVLLQFLPQLAAALGNEYDIEILEIHHSQKKDAPSGTALMLGEAIANAKRWDLDDCKKICREGLGSERPKIQIGFQAIRGGDVTGVHTIYFLGPGERIEITHQAHSRKNFARGALIAAEWLKDMTPGELYSMQDLLKEKDVTECQ